MLWEKLRARTHDTGGGAQSGGPRYLESRRGSSCGGGGRASLLSVCPAAAAQRESCPKRRDRASTTGSWQRGTPSLAKASPGWFARRPPKKSSAPRRSIWTVSLSTSRLAPPVARAAERRLLDAYLRARHATPKAEKKVDPLVSLTQRSFSPARR